MADTNTNTSSEILAASASNVTGYMRNVERRLDSRARRQQAPGEDFGGRGTKRNRAMAVTSAAHRTLTDFNNKQTKPEEGAQQATAAAVVDVDEDKNQNIIVDEDGEEWDDVDFVPKKEEAVKLEAGVTLATLVKESGEALKEDASAGGVVDVDATMKKETANAGSRNEPLVSPMETPEGYVDPDVAQQRAEAMARKWATKNLNFAASCFKFVSLVRQGRALFQQAHHPALLSLLQDRLVLLPGAGRTVGTVTAVHEVIEQISSELPIAVVSGSKNPASSEISPSANLAGLTPCWITRKKDGCKTALSLAVMRLLAVVDAMTEMKAAPLDNSAATAIDVDDNESDTAASMPKTTREWYQKLAREAHVVEGGADFVRRQAAGARLETTEDQTKTGEKRPRVSEAKDPSPKIRVSSPAHYAQLFLALARKVGLCARLCVTFSTYDAMGTKAADAEATAESAAAFISKRKGGPAPKKTASKKKLTKVAEAAVAQAVGEGVAAPSGDAPVIPPDRKAFYWCEVWCPEKNIFVSVNTCPHLMTEWGQPYTIALGGDHVVDVTPRYCSSWSKIHWQRLEAMHTTKGYVFREELDATANDDAFLWQCPTLGTKSAAIPRMDLTPSQRVLAPLCKDVTRRTAMRMARESKQLQMLLYSDPVPDTIGAVKSHPLYVMEEHLGRWESIYPQDATTIVGYLRSKPVFKRSAIHQLRSKEGWLRLGRSVRDDETPFKTPAPLPSRPLVSNSQLYGNWQTDAFKPAPITEDGRVPRYNEKTTFYPLLGQPAGQGLRHITEKSVAVVARMMQIDYCLAVVEYVKKMESHSAGFGRSARTWQKGTWQAKIEGIVVPDASAEALLVGYHEWRTVKERQEAQRRRQRAMKWWRLFIGRSLAKARIESQYLRVTENAAPRRSRKK